MQVLKKCFVRIRKATEMVRNTATNSTLVILGWQTMKTKTFCRAISLLALFVLYKKA